jgi:hypothetical protein
LFDFIELTPDSMPDWNALNLYLFTSDDSPDLGQDRLEFVIERGAPTRERLAFVNLDWAGPIRRGLLGKRIDRVAFLHPRDKKLSSTPHPTIFCHDPITRDSFHPR